MIYAHFLHTPASVAPLLAAMICGLCRASIVVRAMRKISGPPRTVEKREENPDAEWLDDLHHRIRGGLSARIGGAD